MTRICFITGSMPPEKCGVADYTTQLAHALIALDPSLEILVLTGSGQEQSQPFRIKAAVQSWNYRGVWQILRELATFQPDIIHLQYPAMAYSRHPAVNLLPWLIRLASGVGRFKPKLLALTLHEYSSFRRLGRWRIQSMLPPLSEVIAVDPLTLCLLKKPLRFLGKPAHYIPIGSNVGTQLPSDYLADPEKWQRERGLKSSEQPTVAYFGFVSPSKGLDTLLKGFRLMKTPARLLLVAERQPQSQAYQAYFEQLVTLEQALTQAKAVLWTGFQPGPEVLAYLASADVIALPFADGLSPRRGSLQAALASGRPLVTTYPADLALAHEAGFLEGENIWLVEPAEPAALALALDKILADQALQARLGQAALQLQQRFSWNSIARQHLTLYQPTLPLNKPA